MIRQKGPRNIPRNTAVESLCRSEPDNGVNDSCRKDRGETIDDGDDHCVLFTVVAKGEISCCYSRQSTYTLNLKWESNKLDKLTALSCSWRRKWDHRKPERRNRKPEHLHPAMLMALPALQPGRVYDKSIIWHHMAALVVQSVRYI